MEEFKVGDRVKSESFGEGIIIEPLYRIYVNTECLYISDTKNLTKIKPKVKRWQWVIQDNNGIVSLTSHHHTEKGIESVISGCEGWKVLQKIDATERIDNE